MDSDRIRSGRVNSKCTHIPRGGNFQDSLSSLTIPWCRLDYANAAVTNTVRRPQLSIHIYTYIDIQSSK
jgi:hypothetical protein